MNIDFKNNAERKTFVRISDINLYPQKEIKLFDFEYENGVCPKIKSSPITDFPISPGSTLVYFKFKIKGKKKFGIEDIERYKNIPILFKIIYSSPNFKERTKEIKMENFYKNIVKIASQ